MYEGVLFHQDTEKFKRSRFLVTGGAGFVGSHIVDYLMQHGAAGVRVIDNLSEGREKNIAHWKNDARFQFIEGDICDSKLLDTVMEGIDYVSHQAALGSVPRSIKNPLATNRSNVDGFITVIDSARRNNVKRLVYASSSSVYGDHPVLPKVEEQIGNQLSPYAVSKRVNELYADVFARCYQMEILGLRYFNIFGPRQNPEGPYAAVIPLFISALTQGGQAFINGDGGQTRDFTYVQNAVQANIRALFSSHPEATGKVYNVAVGERISVKKMFEMLREFSGSSLEPSFREAREGDIRDSLADISRAETFLDYKPLVKMQEGLKLTLHWFLKS